MHGPGIAGVFETTRDRGPLNAMRGCNCRWHFRILSPKPLWASTAPMTIDTPFVSSRRTSSLWMSELGGLPALLDLYAGADRRFYCSGYAATITTRPVAPFAPSMRAPRASCAPANPACVSDHHGPQSEVNVRTVS